MICPWLSGIPRVLRAPVTWLLVLANFFVYSQNKSLSEYSRTNMGEIFSEETTLNDHGLIYSRYLRSESKQNVGTDVNYGFMGVLAFQDEVFLKKVQAQKLVGDKVALLNWSRRLTDYFSFREFYPAFQFGVSNQQKTLFSFLSYQFYHEDFFHLLGNMVFLLIVGGFLEVRCGSLSFLGLYLLSGVFAALSYSLLLTVTSAPLIGASGGLCGLFGFLALRYPFHKTQVAYFALPRKGYFGFIQLPTLCWVLWFCVLEDLSGWFSRVEFFQPGTSHFVHLAGFTFGAVIGLYQYSRSESFGRGLSQSVGLPEREGQLPQEFLLK